LGLVHSDESPIEFQTIEFGNGDLAICLLHGDETESTGLVGVWVGWKVAIVNFSEFSKDSLKCFFGGVEGKAKLKAELVKHEGYLADCKFFHSPSKMLTSSADETTLLWDVERGSILQTFHEHKANILEVALVGQTQFLSTSVDKSIKLWDVRTSAKEGSVQTFTGHEADVNGITVLGGGSSNSPTFGTCSEDGTIRVWDCRSYGEVAQYGEIIDQSDQDPFSDGDAGFTSITSSASGRLLFCGHSEGSVECFDILSPPSPDPLYTLHNAHEIYVSCVKVSPKGDVLCTASWDTRLKLFA